MAETLTADCGGGVICLSLQQQTLVILTSRNTIKRETGEKKEAKNKLNSDAQKRSGLKPPDPGTAAALLLCFKTVGKVDM